MLWKMTQTHKFGSEQEAMDFIENIKSNQATGDEHGAYTLTKYKTDYKCKKDRKTGEVVEELWICMIEKTYEV